MAEPKGGRRAALLLAVVALRVPAGVRTQTPVPVPWAAGALGLVAGFGYLALLFPFGGALTGHTAFGVVANAATLADKLELSALGLLVLILLALLARRRPLSAVRP